MGGLHLQPHAVREDFSEKVAIELRWRIRTSVSPTGRSAHSFCFRSLAGPQKVAQDPSLLLRLISLLRGFSPKKKKKSTNAQLRRLTNYVPLLRGTF